MSTQTDYSAEEWKAISCAPVAAGLLITLAETSDSVGMAKEVMAVGQAIRQSSLREAPAIVRALAESVKSGAARPDLPEVPAGDRAQTKEALINTIRTAVRAVETKSPGEVEAYKTWLACVAAKVLQASKEGGFLDFGGTLVSQEEETTIAQLADVLGIDRYVAAAS